VVWINVLSRDGVSATPFVQQSYNSQISGFTLIGKNNSSIISTGIFIGTKLTINVAVAVNYSWILGNMNNILVSQFDTGIHLQESNVCSYDSVKVLECRNSLLISGKSVNIYFSNCSFLNETLANTSSTADTVGVRIQSIFTYTGGVEGRPEGIAFNNCLIYGGNYTIDVNNVLSLSVDSCIIDGGGINALRVSAADGVRVANSYLYSGGDAVVSIPATVADDAFSILNCEIIGNAGTTTYGIFAQAGGKIGFDISKNRIEYCSIGMFINNGISFIVRDNIGANISGTYFILVQTNGANSIVDGNILVGNGYPVICQPSTFPSLFIGANKSNDRTTLYRGVVTLLAGQTTVALPNTMYTTDWYIRPITKVVPQGDIGTFYVTEETNWSAGTLTVGAALGADVKIRYEVCIVPYSATV
jgi:hypothetical protein